MSAVHRVLFAVLRDLGIGVSIADAPQRLMRQHAVYLAQEAGVHFGYQYAYGWYASGPYSPRFSEDLHDLATSLPAMRIYHAADLEAQLIESVRRPIAEIVPHLAPPCGVTQDEWLRVRATVHFGMRYLGYRVERARRLCSGASRAALEHVAPALQAMPVSKISYYNDQPFDLTA